MIRSKVVRLYGQICHTYTNSLSLNGVPGAVTPSYARALSGKAGLDLSGVIPPIATPFDGDENIDYGRLEHNMGKWNQTPIKGYLVQGSNGEYTYLTADERVKMVAQVKKMSSPDKLVLAGSGCESTRDTMKMTRLMAEAGADAVMVVTPCYYKGRMNNDAMLSHFTKVADDSPVPVILYSVPANTGIDLDPHVVTKLSSHPNIIGMKDSGGDIAKIGAMLKLTQTADFQILSGSASFLFPALTVGAVGGVCALANMLPNEVCQLQQLFTDGKYDEARSLQLKLIAPNAAVTKKYGVSGLKLAMDWFNFYGGPTRSPLQPLNSAEIEDLKSAFAEFL